MVSVPIPPASATATAPRSTRSRLSGGRSSGLSTTGSSMPLPASQFVLSTVAYLTKYETGLRRQWRGAPAAREEAVMEPERQHAAAGGEAALATTEAGTMRAIVQGSYGSTDVLRLARIAPPKIADGE